MELKNFKSYNDFVNEKHNINTDEPVNEIFGKLINWIKQGIGNKQVDAVLQNYQTKMIDLQNQKLGIKYGNKIANFLIPGGATKAEQLVKDITKEAGADMLKTAEDSIKQLNDAITPKNSGKKAKDGGGLFYVTDANGKVVQITNRMTVRLNSKISQIKLEINKSILESLNKIKASGVAVDDAAVKEMTAVIQKNDAEFKKLDAEVKKLGPEPAAEGGEAGGKVDLNTFGNLYGYKDKDGVDCIGISLGEGYGVRVSNKDKDVMKLTPLDEKGILENKPVKPNPKGMSTLTKPELTEKFKDIKGIVEPKKDELLKNAKEVGGAAETAEGEKVAAGANANVAQTAKMGV